jgi:hypothetical protein
LQVSQRRRHIMFFSINHWSRCIWSKSDVRNILFFFIFLIYTAVKPSGSKPFFIPFTYEYLLYSFINV